MTERDRPNPFIAAKEACRSRTEALVRQLVEKLDVEEEVDGFGMRDIPLRWEQEDQVPIETSVSLSSLGVSFTLKSPRYINDQYLLGLRELKKESIFFKRTTADTPPRLVCGTPEKEGDPIPTTIERGENQVENTQEIETGDGLEILQFRLAQLEEYVTTTPAEELRSKL